MELEELKRECEARLPKDILCVLERFNACRKPAKAR